MNANYKYLINVNQATGFKERLARALRTLADSLDKKHTLAVQFKSFPQIHHNDVNQCLELGIKHAESLLADQVKTTAVENVLQGYVFTDKKLSADEV